MRQRRSSRFPGIRRWGFRDRLGRGHVLDDTPKEQFSFFKHVSQPKLCERPCYANRSSMVTVDWKTPLCMPWVRP